MKLCPDCKAPMINTCVNVNCNSAKNALEQREKEAKDKTPTRRRKKNSGARGRKHLEVPNGNIPAHITGDGGPTLMRYYKYTTAKGWKGEEETRRGALMQLLLAEITPTVDAHRKYVNSFGPSRTRDRIEAVKQGLEKQIGGQWFIEEGHARWPSKQKLISDVEWLTKVRDHIFPPSN